MRYLYSGEISDFKKDKIAGAFMLGYLASGVIGFSLGMNSILSDGERSQPERLEFIASTQEN